MVKPADQRRSPAAERAKLASPHYPLPESLPAHKMAAVNSPTASLLLPDVMSKIASLEPSSLAAVHQFLIRLELAQLTEEIQDDAEALRQSGELAPDLIAAALREHRRNHPYAA